MRKMLPPEAVTALESPPSKSQFAGEFAHMIYENAFVELWARPGLTPKDRSILTLGILIAQGSQDELKAHVAIALKNGVTREELGEILYHAMGYAGIPAAAAALTVARKVVDGPPK